MSGERLSTPGISSRRSACDRCRFQKARCLREHASQMRCDRCLRADAECITSPIFRMRSYSGEDTGFLDRTRKRQRQDIGSQQRGSRTPDEGPVPTTFEWLNQPLSAELDATGDGDAALYDTIFSEAMDPAFDQYNTSFHQSGGLVDTVPTPIASQPALLSSSSHPTSSGSLDDTIGISAECNDSHMGVSPEAQNGAMNCAELETPMQRLSRIDYKLITLLDRLDKGPPKVTMDTLVSPLDESKSNTPAVDDILNSTREYIDVLKALGGTFLPSSATSITSGRRRSKSGSRYQQDSDSSSMSGDESIANSPADTAGSLIPSPSLTPDGQTGLKLDAPSLLLILTSYIHVLRLYVVVSSHIHHFLKEVSESDDPKLCPVPGLSFSNFPIQSGNLQTIILIQIVTSLFERMETLLGLPREFRMKSRKGEPQGLLSDHEFMELARCILRKEYHGRPELGRGGTRALRKNITRVKQLLRESIAP
ncbi:hypothetical protein VMCG_04866 [Cytospora schulzeri]|uniref:Zn(2)-C6 fungal-type domain-containing protein n=1 Tax=Cytospora schulzeri TaxID=448051 RepID=A0A423WN29_9PEZI|nr:hypothetical protein VMCG_04866 [Valsa malicola]